MSNGYDALKYYGTSENNSSFLDYVTKEVGDTPVVEVNFYELVRRWSEELGVGIKIIGTNHLGKKVIQIIEDGFDPKFIGGIVRNTTRVCPPG